MAKVTGPLFSLDAMGKLADTLVYAICKGLNYLQGVRGTVQLGHQ